MKIIKPKKLKAGDTIGILGVSGAIKDYNLILNSKKYFEEKGYNVIISDTCKYSHRYMTGKNDLQCVGDLHSFFLDKNINMILCARGGYGTIRLLDYIDWDIIKKNPKIFAGYSDITVLLNMIFRKTGLITFHSPMAKGDFADLIIKNTESSFFKTLSGITQTYKVKEHIIFYDGIAQGKLWGGNLASLVSLCGTDFVPNEDLILILEDLNEPVYKIDKMLTQLFNMAKIRKNVKGIAFGEFKDIENQQWLNELLNEFANKLKIPCCGNFKITHNKEKDTIPIGVNAIFNANTGEIKLTEQYVC